MNWQYMNPVRIVSSDQFSREIIKIIGGNSNFLLVCSNRFKKTEDFKRFKSLFKNFSCFSDIENNPSINSCQKAINYCKNIEFDIIIAIGGGSVIDTAKAMRMATYKSCFDIRFLFSKSKKQSRKPLFIAIPTTHGTSSELTMWATVWDKAKKKSIPYLNLKIIQILLFMM